MTLTNLEKVSASLGAKAVLWELFNFNPPSLRLYVELCATSQFLSEILINNPGMIDDLVDSLVVDRPSPGAAIKAGAGRALRGAEDLAPILWSFRNKEWVRIGTRDILGREPVREVTRELADVAEAIVTQVARDQWQRRTERFGHPAMRRRRPARPLGDRRPGQVRRPRAELSQRPRPDLPARGRRPDRRRVRLDLQRSVRRPRSSSACSRRWGAARRPARSTRSTPGSGRTAPPAPWSSTFDAFRDYLQRSTQTWERMAFTRARVIYATGGFGKTVAEAIRAMLAAPVEAGPLAGQVLAMRRKLEASRPRHHLKRGFGGVADIEFIVQYLQLVHAARQPALLRPNLWDALDALHRHAIIDAQTHVELRDAYDFLRAVEGRLRLIQNRSVGELPQGPVELERLARRLNYESADRDRLGRRLPRRHGRRDPPHPRPFRSDHHRRGAACRAIELWE